MAEHRFAEARELGVAGAAARLDAALPALCRAAGADVIGLVGPRDPLMAIRAALDLLGFDEVIILSSRESGWLARDLPRSVRALGVPASQVVVGTARGVDASRADDQSRREGIGPGGVWVDDPPE